MLHGAQFPSVVVFGEAAGDYWLADGYHRWHAAGIAGLQTISADVRPGGRREAILHSVGANAEHAWRRSNEDKRKAVQTLLNDPEWSGWSDREIARRCGVFHTTVQNLRPPSGKVCEIDPERPTTRKVEHNGTVYEQAVGEGSGCEMVFMSADEAAHHQIVLMSESRPRTGRKARFLARTGNSGLLMMRRGWCASA